MMNDQIYTVLEVAEYLKISKSKIYYLVSRREIPHLKIGKNVRFRETDLMKWMENNSIEKRAIQRHRFT